VPIRHAGKAWWPDEGITKDDIARFYDDVSPLIQPWLAHRPLVAERCPDGMLGSCFFQKNFARGVPAGVPRVPLAAKSTGRMLEYVVGGSKEALLSLVNLGCIAIHTMNCRVDALEQPDWIAFDLDPTSGDFADAARLGQLLHEGLEQPPAAVGSTSTPHETPSGKRSSRRIRSAVGLMRPCRRRWRGMRFDRRESS